jgi:hypothetical protein
MWRSRRALQHLISKKPQQAQLLAAFRLTKGMHGTQAPVHLMPSLEVQAQPPAASSPPASMVSMARRATLQQMLSILV